MIPQGYLAVPLGDGGHGALRLAVLVRIEPDPGAGHLVVLRELLTGRVLLGCVIDAGGVLQEWIELWIQDVTAVAGSPAGARSALSNAIVDRRWTEQFEAVRVTESKLVIETGWEREHPPPMFVDVGAARVVAPCDAEGRPLELCTDEALLAARGLPSYGSSLERYLYLSDLGDASPFVPVTPDAPRNDATSELDAIWPAGKGLAPLNRTAGLVHARRSCPIGLEAFIDVLGGSSWAGVSHGSTPLPLGEPLAALSQASTVERLADGHLVLGQDGRAGRPIEVFHLKTRLLVDLVESTAAHLERTQRPLLDLRPESFRVRLGAAGTGLPFLWTARGVLADGGAAIALPVEGSDLDYYVRGGGDVASIYRPASGRQQLGGTAALRIRRLLPEANGVSVIEGTIETSERLEFSDNDLLWLRVPVGGGRLDVYSNLERDQAMASGELRFRSVPQRFGETAVEQMRRLEGVPLDGVPFEVVPLLSAPCDMYALAVIALRTYFVHEGLSLPVVLDEMLSLARQVATDHQAGVSLPLRVEAILDRDPRWLESLGPQHLLSEKLAAGEVLDSIPRELWYRTLAMLVRLFPGVGPDSHCRDLGDAPVGGLHKIFEPTVDDLRDLLVRSRSLIVVDWSATREIHSVIRRFASGLAG